MKRQPRTYPNCTTKDYELNVLAPAAIALIPVVIAISIISRAYAEPDFHLAETIPAHPTAPPDTRPADLLHAIPGTSLSYKAPTPLYTTHIHYTITVWSDGTCDIGYPEELTPSSARNIADRIESSAGLRRAGYELQVQTMRREAARAELEAAVIADRAAARRGD